MLRLALSLISVVSLVAVSALPAQAADTVKTKRGYVDNRYGQLHFIMASPADGSGKQKPPLILLHQTANTALEYGLLTAEMGRDRVVIAIDTPGYGGSDGPKTAPRIEDYAAAIAEGLQHLGYSDKRPVDIMGYHTGAFTAGEIAITHPKMVRRLVLSGVYVVSADRLKKAKANLPRYKTSREFFGWFCSALPKYESGALASNISDADWGAVIADSLKATTQREFGHDAAFDYAGYVRDRIPKIVQKTMLLAIDDGIRDATVESKPLFKAATLVDLPQYHEGVFFTDPAAIAAAVRQFLD